MKINVNIIKTHHLISLNVHSLKHRLHTLNLYGDGVQTPNKYTRAFTLQYMTNLYALIVYVYANVYFIYFI